MPSPRSLGSLLPLSGGLLLAATLVLGAGPASAYPGILNAWQARYQAQSASGDAAGCQLCHANANGGSPWNGYGWDILVALADPACDVNQDGVVSNDEAFYCVEPANSDGDGSGWDNATEIGLSTQPGWTNGPYNTLFDRSGSLPGQLPPADIGPLDPDGTEPPPTPPPPPPDDGSSLPPGQTKRHTIVVRPGQSIQAAIDQAHPGTRIYVLAGVYHEYASPNSAISITKRGIRLIGQTTKKKRVIIENAGNQRNGISVVPDDRTDCLSCHSSLKFPFPTLPGVEGGLKMREPMIDGIEVRSITIRGFTNGLFAENLDGFRFEDVKAIDNSGYGIFPTLSKNGIVTRSYATGSDDSGIWVETSENVRVTRNLVEGNVNGFEVSNSDGITLDHNLIRHNSLGIASLLLPDIFDDRPGSKHISLLHNVIHDNNKENTARPGSILSEVPKGIGILQLAADDSLIAGNYVANNEFVGIGIANYCLATATSADYNCAVDPTITPEFLTDEAATNNRVEGNVLMDNGLNPPGGLFGALAADLTLVTNSAQGNCYADNIYTTYVSFLNFVPVIPTCP